MSKWFKESGKSNIFTFFSDALDRLNSSVLDFEEVCNDTKKSIKAKDVDDAELAVSRVILNKDIVKDELAKVKDMLKEVIEVVGNETAELTEKVKKMDKK